jgi:hypothetical protein
MKKKERKKIDNEEWKCIQINTLPYPKTHNSCTVASHVSITMEDGSGAATTRNRSSGVSGAGSGVAAIGKILQKQVLDVISTRKGAALFLAGIAVLLFTLLQIIYALVSSTTGTPLPPLPTWVNNLFIVCCFFRFNGFNLYERMFSVQLW